jgi:hypothetical protein
LNLIDNNTGATLIDEGFKVSGYADNLRNNGGERRSRTRASLRLFLRRVGLPVCRGPRRKVLLVTPLPGSRIVFPDAEGFGYSIAAVTIP